MTVEPCRTVRMNNGMISLWVNQKALNMYRRLICVANMYITMIKIVSKTPVIPASKEEWCEKKKKGCKKCNGIKKNWKKYDVKKVCQKKGV